MKQYFGNDLRNVLLLRKKQIITKSVVQYRKKVKGVENFERFFTASDTTQRE